MSGKKLITKRGLKKLEDELKMRTDKMRDEIADRLDEAKAIGDLSENSAYHAALEEYQFNEARINELKDLISKIEVAPDESRDTDIDIGDTVKVKDLSTGRIITYDIVGLGEGDPLKGQVSSDSAVGGAIIGKKVGDKVKVSLPRGEQELEIIKIGQSV
ncbi:transcription elongation factor GreA [Candidatus Dojkabacteria bacterium]|nr:transcription elongation factor GreA [Candidatus Dojkabacteria bacterium]